MRKCTPREKANIGKEAGKQCTAKVHQHMILLFDVEFGTKIYFPASRIIFLCFFIFSISPWETGEIWGNSDNFFFDFFTGFPYCAPMQRGTR